MYNNIKLLNQSTIKMQSISINKSYIPLVNKILSFDNYEIIDTIVTFGISSHYNMEKYNTHRQLKGLETLDTKKYLSQISTLENDNKLLRTNIQELEKRNFKEKHDLINDMNKKHDNNLIDIREKLTNKTNEYYNLKEKIEKENELKLNIKITRLEEDNKMKVEEFKKIIKNMDETIKHLSFEKNNLRETEFKKYEEKIKEEVLNIEEKNNKYTLCLEERISSLESNYEEKINYEMQKLKDINELLREDNEKYKNKYDKLEVNSVLKGKEYENHIERELLSEFNKCNNVWSLERCSKQKGKGDFIAKNNYTNYRIMIEAKHMPSVSASCKEQQPKFINDLRNPINNYDGGLMVASERISGKKDWISEKIDNKVAMYLQNYSLNDPKRIYSALEAIHEIIKKSKEKKGITDQKALECFVDIYKKKYNGCKKINELYKEQSVECDDIKTMISINFNIDVDEYINDQSKSDKSLNIIIDDNIIEFIKEEIENNPNIVNSKLENICFNNFKDYINEKKVSKSKIKKWIKEHKTIN